MRQQRRARILLLPALVVLGTTLHGQQPTIVSTTASPAYGSSSSITVIASDPGGYGNINLVDLLINYWLDGQSACYVAYVPSGPSAGLLLLIDDAGEPNRNFAGSISFSSGTGSGTATNHQCTINGSGSSVSGSGNSLTLTISITFYPSTFAGPKVLYAAAADNTGNSNWQSSSVFTVGPPPPVVSMIPASGGGSSSTFTFYFTDTNGWQDGNIVDVLMNYGINGAKACYFAYVPAVQTLYLVDDAGDAGGPFAGSVSFSGSSSYGTGSGTASNSQCMILGSGSSYSISGTSLALTISFTFTPSFAGDQIFYLAARDSTYNSGWLAAGSWTVGTGSSGPPIVTLSDLTQGGPYYFVGDSFTVTVTGTAGQPVSVIQNGAASGVLGYTDASGVYSVSGTWGVSNAGAYAQVWSVAGVPAAPLVFEIIESPGSTDGPVSIPNSFTGGTPPLACADITGNWIATPSSGFTSESDLTQNGNQITGTRYSSSGPSCGVITWTVSGNYSSALGQGFTLTATNPSPRIDGCDYVAFDPDIHRVRLSGSSCSTGTGTWQNSSGSGTLTQQSKTTPNVVTANKTTAHYQVSYATYIPVDHLIGPTACLYNTGSLFIGIPKTYIGDAFRGNPTLVGSGYRAFQSTVVIPGSGYVYNPYLNTGATRNYGLGSPANGTTLDSTPTTSDIYNGPWYGLDEDPTPNDCKLWNDKGQATTSLMATPSVTFPYPTQAQVLFAGIARDPLEPPVGGINWSMNVVVDESSPTAPTAYVNFNHTCYPAHIVMVNGVTVYKYIPRYNNLGYIGACLLGFGKLTGVSTAVQVNTQ